MKRPPYEILVDRTRYVWALVLAMLIRASVLILIAFGIRVSVGSQLDLVFVTAIILYVYLDGFSIYSKMRHSHIPFHSLLPWDSKHLASKLKNNLLDKE
jgi:hypothetical protein